MYQINPLLIFESKNSEEFEIARNATLFGVGVKKGAEYLAASPRESFLAAPGEKSNVLPHLKSLKVKLPNGEYVSLFKYMSDKGLKVTNIGSEIGPVYYRNSKIINTAIKPDQLSKWAKPTFAHEFGHSEPSFLNSNKYGKRIYNYSSTLNTATVLAQIINCTFNSDDESRKKVAHRLNIAGGITALPTIAEELNASIKGTRMLGLKGAERARSFIGIASYLTMMFSPAIIYHVSETTRKLLLALKKAKNENAKVKRNLDNLKKQDIKVAV